MLFENIDFFEILDMKISGESYLCGDVSGNNGLNPAGPDDARHVVKHHPVKCRPHILMDFPTNKHYPK